jgi:TRAP-type mannitol/chloroaromatic compound transport system permease small subunit
MQLSRRIDAINVGIGRLQALLLLVAVILCAGHAITRKTLNLSSNGALELQWYLFSCVFLLGAAYTLKWDEHVRIDVLASRFGARTRAWIDIIGTLAVLLPVSLLIVTYSWPSFINSWNSSEMSPDYGGLIRWPVRLLLPMGFALLILQAVSELIKRIDILRTRTAPGATEANHG